MAKKPQATDTPTTGNGVARASPEDLDGIFAAPGSSEDALLALDGAGIAKNDREFRQRLARKVAEALHSSNKQLEQQGKASVFSNPEALTEVLERALPWAVKYLPTVARHPQAEREALFTIDTMLRNTTAVKNKTYSIDDGPVLFDFLADVRAETIALAKERLSGAAFVNEKQRLRFLFEAVAKGYKGVRVQDFTDVEAQIGDILDIAVGSALSTLASVLSTRGHGTVGDLKFRLSKSTSRVTGPVLQALTQALRALFDGVEGGTNDPSLPPA